KEGIDLHDLREPNNQSYTFHSVTMEFKNALNSVAIQGTEKQSNYSNYYLGKDPKKWASNVSNFKAVDYTSLYNGISVKTFSEFNNVRFDFIVAPNSDPSVIALEFKGQNRMYIRNNDLIIVTEVGEIIQKAPLAYQDINGKRIKVKCSYKLQGNIISFETGSYNHNYTLTIDPTLVFASFTGSTSDNFGMTATYDNLGCTYAGGICYGEGYPITTGAYQVNFNDGASNPYDMTLTKFSPDGSNLLFSTYVGGGSVDNPQSIIVDSHNNLLVLGSSNSMNFPVTTNAIDTSHNGYFDIIVLKLKYDGTALLASTYIGGSDFDGKNVILNLRPNYADDLRGGILVDASDNIYIATSTKSINYPVTSGCAQPNRSGSQDGCVAKLSPDLSSFFYSTFLGGTVEDAAYNIALDDNNCLYVTGGTMSTDFPVTSGALITSNTPSDIDGFLTHLSADGSTVLHSTYLGTTLRDQSHFVQLDKNGDVYVFGQTFGSYPVSPGAYSNPGSGQFIHCLNPELNTTIFSTVVGTGASGPDISPAAFLVDNCNNIYISGWGGSLNNSGTHVSSTIGLPISSNAFQSTTDGNDFYFMQLSEHASSLLYATYFGGNISHEHVDGGTSRFDKTGAIYQAICAGCGAHSDLPTTPGAWSQTNNSFNCNNAVVKFSFNTEITSAQFTTFPSFPVGCVPLSVNFTNQSLHAVSYEWDFGDGNFSTDEHPAHTFTTPGDYFVTLIATDSSTCNIKDTTFLPVTVYPDVDVQVQSPLHICYDSSAQITATITGATSTHWIPSTYLNSTTIGNPVSTPPANITYTVNVSNAACSASDSVKVFVHRNTPSIILDVSQQCSNNPTVMSADTIYSSYSWSTGATGQQISVLLPGTYSLTTTNSYGCIGKDSASISNYTNVQVEVRDTGLCAGQSVQLKTTEGNYIYNWTPSSGLDNSTIFNPVSTVTETTTYTVTITNGPCVTSNMLVVSVLPLPVINAEPSSITVLPGETVDMTGISDTISYWSPPRDLICDVCFATAATPDSNTVYYATVYNANGCSATDSVQVFLAPTLYIPNAFSPNTDVSNPVFKPEYIGITKIEAFIFNRWGELIYKWDTLDGSWDGTYKGHKCQQDVYIYKINATDYLENVIERAGTVTLLR
ncbi:MAG TPA: PKD domain-containing protein, partial [Bacteroidia bacterium]